MNKILTLLAIFFSFMTINQIVNANPRDNNNTAYSRHEQYRQSYRDAAADGDVMQEKRREREERGVRRLQQHKWQEGYVMPQHYRGDGYKIEYREYNLPKPTRNQQWYKINNDYILVDLENNNIIQIMDL